jgi:hypothetical protein
MHRLGRQQDHEKTDLCLYLWFEGQLEASTCTGALLPAPAAAYSTSRSGMPCYATHTIPLGICAIQADYVIFP